ncbi:AraC family transcriptional regulator [uncultured Tenacibaculum sp.]|uniref:helix-turn-helix domain-containing protein n=1 Tax=uncultured Tenacibaculum sp. TaxID=174713 RepID=UPI0026204FBC|nr:AraC family transcriptional regulator [uncultured Tenacibaculum sp.]
MKEKLFFLFILVCSFCGAQLDSREDFEVKLSYYKDSNLDSLYYYANKNINSKNLCVRLSCKNAIIYYHYKNKNYSEVEKQAIKLLEETNFILQNDNINPCVIKTKIGVFNRLFWLYKNTEEFEKAYNELVKFSDYVKSIDDKKIDKFHYLVTIEMSKALIKNELKLEDDSKEILLKVVRALKNKKADQTDTINFNNIITKKADANNLLGKTYLLLSKNKNNTALLDSTIHYYNEAYKYTKLFIPVHSDSELMYTLKMTEVYIAKGEYQKALDLVDTYSKISNGHEYRQEAYLNKAICFQNLKRIDSAIFYAQKLIRIQNIRKSSLVTGYNILSDQYFKNRKLDSAYKYSELTIKEIDETRARKDKTYQLLYDNDIEKIKELNKSIIKSEKNKYTNIILGCIFILLIASGFFLFKRKKYKKEIVGIQNKEKEENIEIETPKEKESQKVEYNIDEELEKKILTKIDTVDNELSFLKSDFTINTLAKALETNSTYISFVFNKNKNETFKQYYSRKKIDYIVEKLNNDKVYRNYSVQALAEEVGYTNASAFTRVFKKYMNITPSVYIKNLKE